MPREGVTLGEVEEIYDLLIEQGQKPSYRRIRARLGEGSLTTIANHVREIHKRRLIEENSSQLALPDEFGKALESSALELWDQLVAAAEIINDEIREEANSQVQLARQAAEEATTSLNRSEEQHTELQRDYEALRSRFEELEGTLLESRTANAQLTTEAAVLGSELETERRQMATLQVELNEQKQNLENVATKLEVSLQKAEEERALHTASREQMAIDHRKEVGSLQNQVSEARSNVHELTLQNEILSKDMSSLESSLDKQAKLTQEAKSVADSLEEELSVVKEQTSQYLRQNENWETRFVLLDQSKAELTQQHRETNALKDSRIADQEQTILDLRTLVESLKAATLADDSSA